MARLLVGGGCVRCGPGRPAGPVAAVDSVRHATMAYKAKDALMLKQAKEGEKVKVRVEEVDGTLTIVKLVKQ